MDKSQMRVRPGFVLGLALVFVFAYLIALLMPSGGGKKKAQIISTHLEMKKIAETLNRRVTETGSLSNIDNSFILRAAFDTNVYNYISTNGEACDYWETPYKLEILARTNFIIFSAGPDKIFGNKDDIIFNSVSNGFVKP